MPKCNQIAVGLRKSKTRKNACHPDATRRVEVYSYAFAQTKDVRNIEISRSSPHALVRGLFTTGVCSQPESEPALPGTAPSCNSASHAYSELPLTSVNRHFG